MKKIYTFFQAIVLIVLLSFSSQAIAENGFEGVVSIGAEATGLDENSYKYGEYNGIKDDAYRITGSIDISIAKEGNYMDLLADHIGHEDREVLLKIGNYGNYKLQMEYSELIHLMGEGKTPFYGIGGNVLTLPSGFGQHSTTAQMLKDPSWTTQDFDLETHRRSASFKYSKGLGSYFTFNLGYRHELKEGTKSIGGPVGTSGKYTASTILPEPVDYRTDDIRAAIAYHGDKGNLSVEYLLSTFNNHYNRLLWENPFTAPPTTAGPPNPAYPEDAAGISLPPDNKYQSISLTATKYMAQTIRLLFMAGYGKMEQDEELLPYTANSKIATPRDLPRNSAEAEIDITHVCLIVNSRPSRKLSVNVAYRYYDTDNKTERALFYRVANDTGTQTDIAAGALYSLPFDYRKNTFNAGTVYGITSATRIKANLEHEIIDRDYRSVDKTKESTLKLGLTSKLTKRVTTLIDFSRAEKRIEGSYDSESLYNAYHSYTSTSGMYNYAAGNFDLNQDLRQLDLAERNRNKYSAKINILPLDKTTVGLVYFFREDDYSDSMLGFQEDTISSYTIDISSSPNKKTTLYTYYTKDVSEKKQSSRSFSSTGPPGTKYNQAIDPTRNWWADHKDSTNTLGIGASFFFMRKRLVIDTDYVYVDSTTEIDMETASALATPLKMPDLETRRDTIDVSGRYKARKNLTIGLGYGYEKYKVKDWAIEGLLAASGDIEELLLLTGSEPDYEAHMMKIFVTLHM